MVGEIFSLLLLRELTLEGELERDWIRCNCWQVSDELDSAAAAAIVSAV